MTTSTRANNAPSAQRSFTEASASGSSSAASTRTNNSNATSASSWRRAGAASAVAAAQVGAEQKADAQQKSFTPYREIRVPTDRTRLQRLVDKVTGRKAPERVERQYASYSILPDGSAQKYKLPARDKQGNLRPATDDSLKWHAVVAEHANRDWNGSEQAKAEWARDGKGNVVVYTNDTNYSVRQTEGSIVEPSRPIRWEGPKRTTVSASTHGDERNPLGSDVQAWGKQTHQYFRLTRYEFDKSQVGHLSDAQVSHLAANLAYSLSYAGTTFGEPPKNADGPKAADDKHAAAL